MSHQAPTARMDAGGRVNLPPRTIAPLLALGAMGAAAVCISIISRSCLGNDKRPERKRRAGKRMAPGCQTSPARKKKGSAAPLRRISKAIPPPVQAPTQYQAGSKVQLELLSKGVSSLQRVEGVSVAGMALEGGEGNALPSLQALNPRSSEIAGAAAAAVNQPPPVPPATAEPCMTTTPVAPTLEPAQPRSRQTSLGRDDKAGAGPSESAAQKEAVAAGMDFAAAGTAAETTGTGKAAAGRAAESRGKKAATAAAAEAEAAAKDRETAKAAEAAEAEIEEAKAAARETVAATDRKTAAAACKREAESEAAIEAEAGERDTPTAEGAAVTEAEERERGAAAAEEERAAEANSREREAAAARAAAAEGEEAKAAEREAAAAAAAAAAERAAEADTREKEAAAARAAAAAEGEESEAAGEEAEAAGREAEAAGEEAEAAEREAAAAAAAERAAEVKKKQTAATTEEREAEREASEQEAEAEAAAETERKAETEAAVEAAAELEREGAAKEAAFAEAVERGAAAAKAAATREKTAAGVLQVSNSNGSAAYVPSIPSSNLVMASPLSTSTTSIAASPIVPALSSFPPSLPSRTLERRGEDPSAILNGEVDAGAIAVGLGMRRKSYEEAQAVASHGELKKQNAGVTSGGSKETRAELALGGGRKDRELENRGEEERSMTPIEEEGDQMIASATHAWSVLGKKAQGLKLAKQAVDMLMKEGCQDKLLAEATSTLADMYFAENQLSLAEQYVRLAMESAQRAKDYTLVVKLANNLGSVLKQAKKLHENVKLHQQIWELVRKNLGLSHPYAQVARANLTESLYDIGDKAGSRSLIQETIAQLKEEEQERAEALRQAGGDPLALYKRTAPAPSPLSLEPGSRVSGSEEGQAMLEEGTNGDSKASALLRVTRSAIARAYMDAGKLEMKGDSFLEAEEAFRMALSLVEAVYGVGSPESGSPLFSLAGCHRAAGKIEEALTGLSSLYDLTLTTQGLKSENAVGVARQLFELHDSAGNWAESARFAESALCSMQLLIGMKVHPSLQPFFNMAIMARAKAGDDAAAEAHRRVWLKGMAQFNGKAARQGGKRMSSGRGGEARR